MPKRPNISLTVFAIGLVLALCSMLAGFAPAPTSMATKLPIQVATLAMGDTLSGLTLTYLPFSTSDTNVATGWFHLKTGQMYDKQNNALAAEPTWTDCVKAVTIDQHSGMYKEVPEETMESGYYIWRQYNTASPAYTDKVRKAKLVYWDQSSKLITWLADL